LVVVLVRSTERSVTALDFVRSGAVVHDPADAGKQLADLSSHTVSQKPTLLFFEVRRVAGFIGHVLAHLMADPLLSPVLSTTSRFLKTLLQVLFKDSFSLYINRPNGPLWDLNGPLWDYPEKVKWATLGLVSTC
jgi:hypothetical protein